MMSCTACARGVVRYGALYAVRRCLIGRVPVRRGSESEGVKPR